MNLNQISLPVTDLSEACKFYQLLGCLQIVDTTHYARFESPEGPATFSLNLVQECPPHGVVIYFEVADVDSTCVSLQRLGLTIDEQPETKRWLWREASLRDPSGNQVRIYHAGVNRRHPPWRVTTAG
ncbi:MAG: VOC family protein [Gammaproteobacteria bacterium]|nr:VOC family protein [Gammaproteobacteria bacterium]